MLASITEENAVAVHVGEQSLVSDTGSTAGESPRFMNQSLHV